MRPREIVHLGRIHGESEDIVVPRSKRGTDQSTHKLSVSAPAWGHQYIIDVVSGVKVVVGLHFPPHDVVIILYAFEVERLGLKGGLVQTRHLLQAHRVVRKLGDDFLIIGAVQRVQGLLFPSRPLLCRGGLQGH